jgi:hypothetical protein
MSKMSEFRKKGRKSREKVGFGPDVFAILYGTKNLRRRGKTACKL